MLAIGLVANSMIFTFVVGPVIIIVHLRQQIHSKQEKQIENYGKHYSLERISWFSEFHISIHCHPRSSYCISALQPGRSRQKTGECQERQEYDQSRMFPKGDSHRSVRRDIPFPMPGLLEFHIIFPVIGSSVPANAPCPWSIFLLHSSSVVPF